MSSWSTRRLLRPGNPSSAHSPDHCASQVRSYTASGLDPREGRTRVAAADDATDRLPSAAVLEFRVLGPLEVVSDGVPVQLGGPRRRATLAILLLSANRV